MKIDIGNGPFTGTYSLTDHLRMDSLSCFFAGGKTEIAYKLVRKKADAEQFVVPNSKTISEAQLVVDNPTDSKSKSAYFSGDFGIGTSNSSNSSPTLPKAPCRFPRPGTDIRSTFKSRTKDGIAIQAAATCSHTLKA